MSATLTLPVKGGAATRQQLDELDALLQRMLELPVDASADAPRESVPPVPKRKVEAKVALRAIEPRETPAPVSRPSAASTVLEEQEQPISLNRAVQAQADDLIKMAAGWQPSSQTWGPLAESWRKSPELPPPATPVVRASAVAPSPASEPHEPLQVIGTPVVEQHVPVVEPLPTAVSAPVETIVTRPSVPVQETTTAVKRFTPAHLWPLVAFNFFFDTFLFLVWPIRGWLRGPVGRNVLAGVGVLGLLGAAAKVGLDWFGWTW